MTDRYENIINDIESNPHYKNSSAFLHEYSLRVEDTDDFSLSDFVDLASEMAKRSPRGRFNFMLHKNLSEDLQALINAIDKSNYVPPHKHNNTDDRRETFAVVKGHFWVVLFDEEGNITDKIKLDNDDPNAPKSYEIKTGVIHTVISDSPFVTLELKQHPSGGYNGATDKVFPDWAIKESDPRASEYFSNLLREVTN